jgi:hypothetical protein
MNLGSSLDSTRGDVRGAMYGFDPVMIAPNGQLVGYAFEAVGRDDQGRTKTEQSFLRADADGSNRKRIGTQVRSPAPTQVSIQIDEKRTATAGIPFLTYPGMVYTSDGSRFGALTHAFTDRGGVYTVVVVRTTGDTLFARSYPFAGTPIPDAVRDSALDAIPRRTLGNGGALVYEPKIGAELRDRIKPLTPRVYRRVQNMVIGRDNTTWLQMRAEGNTKELVALNAKGDAIMSVVIPASSDLYDASLTALWVVDKDADDLPSVVRYRIK